jgi:hypothetical protein
MRSVVRVSWSIVVAVTVASASVDAQRGKELQKPLVVGSQGSFFVGGESKTIPGGPPAQGRGAAPPGEVTVNQYKQMIPDLNALLPSPNPTWKNMAALAVRLKGAILMGHSEPGFFPEQAALIDPSGIRGMISIEMPCPADLTDAQIATLARIPTLVMFGDHLGDVQGGPANWATSHESCEKYVQRVKTAGGDAEMMHLPTLGIRGNSHMLMQDRNNLQLADLILKWIDQHVENRKKST